VREVYEVRGGLEGLAASLVAERGSDDDIQNIVRIHECHGLDVSPHPRAVLVEVNDDFHEAIVTASRNNRLHELLGQNRRFFFNHRIAEQFTEEEAHSSLAGHAEVVAALLKRDAAEAEAAMRRHIRLSMAINLSKMR
jgi:DNA-binding GntR family transcriptional regulator